MISKRLRENKKGFLLVESIIVGVFIFSLFTLIYVGVVPLFGKYEGEKGNNNVRTIYRINEIRNLIIRSDEHRIRLNKGNQGSLNQYCKNTYGGSKVQSKDTSFYKAYNTQNLGEFCSNQVIHYNYTSICSDLLKAVDVKEIYLSSYNAKSLKDYALNCPNNISCKMSRNMSDYLKIVKVRNKDDLIIHQTTRRIFATFNDGTVGEAEVRYNDYSYCQ